MRLYLTALNATDAVLEGFLPAAATLGLPVTVLTDRPDRWPDGVPVAGCAVGDPAAVVAAATANGPPVGLLSNSDHLQEATACAARTLGLPGKDPEAARVCKDKAAARRAVAAAGLDTVRTVALDPGAAATVPDRIFPAVVKPRAGVASEDAYLVADRRELADRVAAIRARRPDVALVVEEHLAGELRTYDTLGDGTTLAVVGGWRTGLGPPPTFVETSLDWAPPPERVDTALRARLDALGVGLGACHTEYVVQDDRVRLIEVNYRLIGDRMDLILAELLGVPLFAHVIRLHLGEPLAALDLPDPSTVDRFARVEYVCADRPGVLTTAPGRQDTVAGGVRLGCRPLREPGGVVEPTGTNRDYLAVLHAVGPDRDTVRAALAAFRQDLRWTIAG
ncbi:siderophore biosynthesis protein [Micromonospora endolithica]|uniref:Siderophore biosynthesis protein n=1 Tax=Micromonospora endolithica TaxID=230091 RepID=A0A3A9ZJ10_9ACTN|nr:siderophore biosynthesis protein [Micromonospora endolithica]RKN47764.1 siderophore biosynthesis protein [Micromonospora endolithica]TWJ21440.1 biotin carboxylase [Micromonospora endolithica]